MNRLVRVHLELNGADADFGDGDGDDAVKAEEPGRR